MDFLSQNIGKKVTVAIGDGCGGITRYWGWCG